MLSSRRPGLTTVSGAEATHRDLPTTQGSRETRGATPEDAQLPTGTPDPLPTRPEPRAHSQMDSPVRALGPGDTWDCLPGQRACSGSLHRCCQSVL